MMKREKQISVFTDNRPGTMARITDALAVAGVNITAIAAWGEVDHGVIRMVVDDALKAAHVLGEHGMLCTETTVLTVFLPNRPGVLNQLAKIFARAKVNVDYCYGADTEESGAIIFRVDSLTRAEQGLRKSPLFAEKKATKKTTKKKGPAAPKATKKAPKKRAGVAKKSPVK